MPTRTLSQPDPPHDEDETPVGDLPLPEDVPEEPEEPEDPQAALLAQVIANAQALAFAHTTNQPNPVKYPKAKDPSMLNGRKCRQLQTWIGKNKFCFCTSPNLYHAETAKVMFAGSFLEGDMQTWFTNYFRNPDNVPPLHVELGTLHGRIATELQT